jgi:hypothetical protein
MHSILRYAAMATVAGALTFGQTEKADQKAADKTAKSGAGGGSVTGCLTKGDAAGQYTLATKGGRTLRVSGGADLEKHAANHTVTLTGTRKGDMFEATAVKHVSATCDMEGAASGSKTGARGEERGRTDRSTDRSTDKTKPERK